VDPSKSAVIVPDKEFVNVILWSHVRMVQQRENTMEAGPSSTSQGSLPDRDMEDKDVGESF